MSDSQNDVGGPEDRGLTSQVGPMEIDWPRSIGYFGGIGLAVALEIIDPPLALFVAAIPFLKMLNRADAPRPVRVVSQFLDGMAKPVGGDGTSTVRLTTSAPLAPARPTTGAKSRAVAGRPGRRSKQPTQA